MYVTVFTSIRGCFNKILGRIESGGTDARTRKDDGFRRRCLGGGWRAGVARCTARRVAAAAWATAGRHCLPGQTWIVLFSGGDVYPV